MMDGADKEAGFFPLLIPCLTMTSRLSLLCLQIYSICIMVSRPRKLIRLTFAKTWCQVIKVTCWSTMNPIILAAANSQKWLSTFRTDQGLERLLLCCHTINHVSDTILIFMGSSRWPLYVNYNTPRPLMYEFALNYNSNLGSFIFARGPKLLLLFLSSDNDAQTQLLFHWQVHNVEDFATSFCTEAKHEQHVIANAYKILFSGPNLPLHLTAEMCPKSIKTQCPFPEDQCIDTCVTQGNFTVLSEMTWIKTHQSRTCWFYCS